MNTIIEAIRSGAEHGAQDGEALFEQNHSFYESERDAVSGLRDCASDAAGALGIADEWQDAWMESYEAAAKSVLLSLYRQHVETLSRTVDRFDGEVTEVWAIGAMR